MPDNNDLTSIIPNRDYADIAKLQEPDVIEAFLQEPATFVMEVITGLMVDGKKGALITGTKLAQGALKARLFQQFSIELQRLRNSGKIPEDFAEKKYGYQTWVDILKIIDEESPDEDKLEALKAMFFYVNKTNASDSDKIVAYQLWQIAKQLNSGELLLLKAAYENRNRFGSENKSALEWENLISAASGLVINGMVAMHEKRLIELSLLTSRTNAGNSIQPRDARLTYLGMNLCSNIETYTLQIKEQ